MSVSDEFFVCKECGAGCIRKQHFDAPFCNACMLSWEPKACRSPQYSTVSHSGGGDNMTGGIWDNITRAYEDNG